MREWLKRRWVQNAALVLGVIAVVYGMIYVDVILRAKEAYQEGEKFWRWHEHPEEKKQALTQKWDQEKADLDRQLAKGKITQEQYQQKLDLAKFDLEQGLEESSIKYAYIWYQTAVELFTPPESKWVVLSRQKMPQAKEIWKQELRAKNIPFEEYMLQ